jgi:hypothetical protein
MRRDEKKDPGPLTAPIKTLKDFSITCSRRKAVRIVL